MIYAIVILTLSSAVSIYFFAKAARYIADLIEFERKNK